MNNNKKIVLIVVIVIFSYFSFPQVLNEGGGSCYQGITKLIDTFLLLSCGVLTTISILIKYKNTAKILSLLSVFLWLFWSIALITNDVIMGFLHVFPLLIAQFIVVKNILYKSI
ncbi:hypothetical protein [Flavobacterium sp.]|uniref:hypothetical protein n=1 Tax=Flavobacterium sp. TaxID=239 RepID=UPI004047D699